MAGPVMAWRFMARRDIGGAMAMIFAHMLEAPDAGLARDAV